MTTEQSGHPDAGASPGAGTSHDAYCRLAATRIRRERPRWVVIWVARTDRYHAWPLFKAPRGTALTANTPDDLTAQMNQIEQATRQRPSSRHIPTGT